MDVGSKDSNQNRFKSRSITSMFLRISATGSSTNRNHGTSEWLSTPWTLGGGNCLFAFFLRGLFAFFFLVDVPSVVSFLGDVTVLAFFLAGVNVLAFFLADVTGVDFSLVDPFGFFDSGLSLRGCLSGVVGPEWVSFTCNFLFTVGNVFRESISVTMHIVECFLRCNDFTGVLIHGRVFEGSIVKPFLFDVTAYRIFKSTNIRREESGRLVASWWHMCIVNALLWSTHSLLHSLSD